MPTISAHISPADKAAADYCYVPFDVPPGTARLDIRYRYSHPRHHGDFDGQGNTIDLGLFDPRGHDFPNAAGFRGWSGSDRDQISLAETAADTTPGYLAGPMPAGRWHVILGLYRIAPEGCDYSVTVELTPRATDAERVEAVAPVDGPERMTMGAAGRKTGEFLPSGPGYAATARGAGSTAGDITAVAAPELSRAPSRGAGWYRGDLQAHTHHSDAKGSLATLAATARTRGLDFLAVTDHNTVSHIRAFGAVSDGLLLLPAMEVTTYYGHMNAWGIHDWVDFRARDLCALRQIVAAIHAQGGLASVNHPKTGGPAWEYGDALDFDCIEVWQGPWPFYNSESFAWWESLLRQGRRVVAVGGSDYHQPEQPMQGNPHLPGHPTTWVYADELSVDGILDGIRRGHVFISADVSGPRLNFTASAGGQMYQAGDHLAPGSVLAGLTIRVRQGAGLVARLVADGALIAEAPVEAEDWSHTWQALLPTAKAVRYFRAEVIIRSSPSEWLMAACSNPIYNFSNL